TSGCIGHVHSTGPVDTSTCSGDLATCSGDLATCSVETPTCSVDTPTCRVDPPGCFGASPPTCLADPAEPLRPLICIIDGGCIGSRFPARFCFGSAVNFAAHPFEQK